MLLWLRVTGNYNGSTVDNRHNYDVLQLVRLRELGTTLASEEDKPHETTGQTDLDRVSARSGSSRQM